MAAKPPNSRVNPGGQSGASFGPGVGITRAGAGATARRGNMPPTTQWQKPELTRVGEIPWQWRQTHAAQNRINKAMGKPKQSMQDWLNKKSPFEVMDGYKGPGTATNAGRQTARGREGVSVSAPRRGDGGGAGGAAGGGVAGIAGIGAGKGKKPVDGTTAGGKKPGTNVKASTPKVSAGGAGKAAASAGKTVGNAGKMAAAAGKAVQNIKVPAGTAKAGSNVKFDFSKGSGNKNSALAAFGNMGKKKKQSAVRLWEWLRLLAGMAAAKKTTGKKTVGAKVPAARKGMQVKKGRRWSQMAAGNKPKDGTTPGGKKPGTNIGRQVGREVARNDPATQNRFNNKNFQMGPGGAVVGKGKYNKLAQLTGVPPKVLKDMARGK